MSTHSAVDALALPENRSTPRYLVSCELEVIRNLVDSLLADKQPEEVEANLYSARLHLTRAIAESDRSAA